MNELPLKPDSLFMNIHLAVQYIRAQLSAISSPCCQSLLGLPGFHGMGISFIPIKMTFLSACNFDKLVASLSTFHLKVIALCGNLGTFNILFVPKTVQVSR